MQTSTITVAVLPETKHQEVKLNSRDLEVSTYRGSGPGGQHRNKTDSGVRIVHKPTGIVVASEQERSQHLNREIAMTSLKTKLLNNQIESELRKRSKDRQKQVGSGMRGDKRRTIRMQDDSVVDHVSGKRMKASKYLRGHLEELH